MLAVANKPASSSESIRSPCQVYHHPSCRPAVVAADIRYCILTSEPTCQQPQPQPHHQLPHHQLQPRCLQRPTHLRAAAHLLLHPWHSPRTSMLQARQPALLAPAAAHLW
jgi:hypothetical protein